MAASLTCMFVEEDITFLNRDEIIYMLGSSRNKFKNYCCK